MLTEMAPHSYDVMLNIKTYSRASFGWGLYRIENFQLIYITNQLNLLATSAGTKAFCEFDLTFKGKAGLRTRKTKVPTSRCSNQPVYS